jgi:transposase
MTYLSSADAPAASEYATVHVAWELSKANWKLGLLLPSAQQMSRFTIKGGDLAAVSARLAAARAKAAKSGLPVRILSCYEAGFEGHWLHRWLEGQGVVSHEVDPSSIEVNRRARRAKTDRIDLARIMRAFLAHLRGEPLACSSRTLMRRTTSARAANVSASSRSAPPTPIASRRSCTRKGSAT